MAELVCQKCLNPVYKKKLCIEHYISYDYNPNIEGYIIRGQAVYFKKVKAFKVFKVEGCPNQREIRIPGNIYDNFVEMKRLLNIHFRDCWLSYVKLIRGDEIIRFEDFVNSLKYYSSSCIAPDMNLYYEYGKAIGVLIEIEDDSYLNIYDWYSVIHRKSARVHVKIAKLLASYDFDRSQGLIY